MNVIKEHEQVQLNDFQAHLQVIIENTTAANNKLSVILSDNDRLLKENKTLEEKVSKQKSESILLSQDIESKRDSIAKREHSAELAELRVKQEREKLDSEIDFKLNALKEKEKQFEHSIAIKKEEIGSLNSIISDLKEEIETLEKEKIEKFVWINDMDSLFASLSKKVESKKEELVNLEKQSALKSKKLSDELSELQKLVDIEREKVQLPKKNLRIMEEQFEKKENNFKTLVERLRKYYEVVYPGQAIKL